MKYFFGAPGWKSMNARGFLLFFLFWWIGWEKRYRCRNDETQGAGVNWQPTARKTVRKLANRTQIFLCSQRSQTITDLGGEKVLFVRLVDRS